MTTSSSYKKRSSFRTRFLELCCFLLVVILIAIVSLYFFKKDFATEIRQVRQAKPNRFFIGIDVSQTVKSDALAAFNRALIERLRHFIGEEEVFYQVSILGIQGCGMDAVEEVVSTRAPKDARSFGRKVERRIKGISTARRSGEDDKRPLTTPLFCFLKKILTERIGERVIIFSDLVNDDEGCQTHYLFPLEEILKFGADKKSQIIFFYPTPHVPYHNPSLQKRLMKQQEDFLLDMRELSSNGKVRAFYCQLPDDPIQRDRFLASHFTKSIPSTIFEIVWDRASRMLDTIVAAIRG
jgi:hypothetical protein